MSHFLRDKRVAKLHQPGEHDGGGPGSHQAREKLKPISFLQSVAVYEDESE